jgi:hypothetical protein
VSVTAYSLKTHNRREDLVVVHAFDLRETFDDKARLEAAVMLDVMHPAVVNGLTAWWQVNQGTEDVTLFECL